MGYDGFSMAGILGALEWTERRGAGDAPLAVAEGRESIMGGAYP